MPRRASISNGSSGGQIKTGYGTALATFMALSLATLVPGCSDSDGSPSPGKTSGGKTSSGGSTASSGGKTATSGGTTATSGGTTASSGGTTASSGGTTATSGGTTASSGGTTASSGGSTATSGGSTASSGGSTASSGGSTASSGGSTASSGGSTASSGGSTVVIPTDIPKPESKLIGWAATEGCSINAGSDNSFIHGEVYKVSGYELQAAVQDDVPRTLLFTGETQGFEFTGSNKTIIGTGNAVIRGGLSVSGGKKNAIFRNMKFEGGEDAIEVSGASCVWFDHIDAFDASDGNMDIVRGSDLITVSWSRFYYVNKNHDHRLSNLNGNKPGDTPGKIRVTFHHNWWGEKVLQRMPRVRHGKVHVFNNYYSTKEGQYFVGMSDGAQLLVEHNWAEYPATENPIKYFDSFADTTIKLVDNHWAGGVPEIKAKEGGWDPPYEYKSQLTSKEMAKAAVMKWAGPDDKKFGK